MSLFTCSLEEIRRNAIVKEQGYIEKFGLGDVKENNRWTVIKEIKIFYRGKETIV